MSATKSVRASVSRKARALLLATAAVAGLAGTTGVARAQSATWTFLGGGAWNTNVNWMGGSPASGSGNTADFSTLNVTSDAIITLDTTQTVGGLIFGDNGLATNSWIVNSGSPGGSLTLDAGTPTITVNNQTATINAIIASANGFTKAGGGTLILNGANSGIAATATLSAGNTGLGNDAALGSATLALAGGNLFATGGARNIANTIELLGNATVITTAQDLTLSGAINVNGGDRSLNIGSSFLVNQNVTISGPVNLSDDGSAHTLTIGGTGGNVVVNGVISNGTGGSGSLNIVTTFGTVTLNGNNTFTGTTTFNAANFGNGTLAIGSNTALGTSTLNWANGNITTSGGDKTIANAILINAGQNSQIAGPDNLTINGTVVNFGGARKLSNNLASSKILTLKDVNLSADSSAQRLVIDGSGTTLITGTVSGPGASSLQFAGSGSLILRGSNSYSQLNLQGGTTVVDMPNGGAFTGSLNLGGYGQGTTTFAKPTFVVKGPGTITLGGAVNIGTSDSRITIDSSAGATTLNVSGSNFSRGSGGGVLDVGVVGSASTMTIGTGGLQSGLLPFVTVNNGVDLATVTGGAVTAYTGYDTYASGNLQNNIGTNALINSATALSVPAAAGTTLLNSLTSKGAGSVAIGLGTGTSLNMGSIGTIFSAPSSGTLVIGSGVGSGNLMAGGSTANAAGELILLNNSPNNQTINSVVTNHGSGATAVTKSGSGRTVLNAANTFTGAVNVNGGTLTLGNASALGTNTTPTINAGGTLDLNGLNLTVNNIGGAAGVITNSAAGLSSLTLGNNNTNAVMNDVFSGNVRIVKTGTGSIQFGNLAGSTNSGGAFLGAGTLRVAGGGFLGSGSIQFSGGTLMIAGSGPNPSYGVVNNSLVAVSGTTGTWRNEQTPVTQNGTLTGAGTLIVSLHPGANPPTFWNADGSAFTGVLRLDTALINAGAAGSVTGFNFTSANAGGPSARLMMTTDTQGFIAGWAGNTNATLQFGELSSNLGAGTAQLRNTVAGTTATYQIGALNTSTTFAGSFVDGGDNNAGITALTKVGTGTLTLTGAGNSYRGTTTVNAGTLLVAAAFTGASPIVVNGGTLLANAALGSGPATVNGGNLVFNNIVTAAHPSVAVNTGGTLHVRGNTSLGTASGTGLSVGGGGTVNLVDSGINTLTIASGTGNALTLGGTSTAANLNFEITGGGSSGSPSADQIVLNNSAATVASNAGGSVVNITPFGAFGGSGDYTLVSSPGGGIDKNSFSLGSLPVALYTTPPDFSTSTSTELKLHLNMAPIPSAAYWRGDLSGVWSANAGTNTNWSDASGNSDTQQLPAGATQVIFSAGTAGNRTTTLGADMGILGLEFADSNAVSIGGTNTLSIGANGITVDAGSAAHTISTAAIALNGNQTWTNNSSNTLTVSAAIVGPYGLTVTRSTGGTGTFLFSGTNTYTGGTTITTGAAVKLGNASALGSGILTMNGGTLDLNNLNLTVGALAGSSGTILNGTAGNATLSFVVPAGLTASSSATIADGAGVVAVTKSGTGTLVLNGVNSYSGGTALSGGTLGINANAALGATTGALSFTANSTLKPSASFALARPINVASGVTGTLDIGGLTTELSGPISGSGTLAAGISGSGGTLVVSSTASTSTGTLSIGSGSYARLNANTALDSGTFLLNNSGTLDLNGKTVNGVLWIPSGGTFTNSALPTLTNTDTAHDAIISNLTSGGINQVQNSFWRIVGDGNIQLNTGWQANSSNTANGALVKYGNGILTLGGGPDAATGNNNQAVLQVGSFNSTAQSFEAGGTVILNKSNTAASGTLRFGLINSGTVIYGSNQITGGATGQINALTINGQGVLDLNGSSGINSTVSILSVGTFSNIPNAGTFSGLVDFGNGTILNNSLNAATLTFGANNSGNAGSVATGVNTSVFTSNIRDGLGTLALVKVGSGTMTFATNQTGTFGAGTVLTNVSNSNGNTFSGGLYINGGSFTTLANDAVGTGTIAVASGANFVASGISGGGLTLNSANANQKVINNGNFFGTLTVPSAKSVGGAGTYNNAVTVASGGRVEPGNGTNPSASVGIMTSAGTLSLDTTALNFEIGNGTVDRVNVTPSNGLVLNGVSTFTLSDVGATPSGTYTLIDYAGTALPNLNNFALASTTAGRYTLSNLINNTANTSIDITITASAVSSQWAVDANGNWSTPSNWTGGVPGIAGDAANFGAVITAPRTVTLDSARTVGAVNFDNASSYTLAGTAVLTLDVPSGNASISVASGTHTIATPVTLAKDLTVTTASGSGVALTGTLTATGRAITKAGAGSVQFNNVRAASLNVSAGSVTIAAGGSANSSGGTSVVQSLAIASGASLDLTNNSAVIDYTGAVGSLVDDVRQHLLNGRLTTSSGDASHRLGYGDNALLGKTTFAGQTVDASSVLVKYTFAGDSNLDGQVDVTDLGALATNWQTSSVWTGGDFNYDGFDDVTDLGMLATNWQAGVGSPLGEGSLEAAMAAVGLGNVSVPEPTTFGAIGICLAAAASRRRTRRSCRD